MPFQVHFHNTSYLYLVVIDDNVVVVTIYATLGDDAIVHGINETEVTTVITSFELMPKFKKILARTPQIDTLIYMEDQLKTLDKKGYKEGVKIIEYQEVIRRGENSSIREYHNFNPCYVLFVNLFLANTYPSPSDIAIIMYTSGSTGVPKGVILLHSNLIATIKAFVDVVQICNENDILIGYLPLAHVFELVVENVGILMGIPIGYSTPLTMIDTSSKIKKGTKGDASVLQPTCMTCVPVRLPCCLPVLVLIRGF